MPIFLPEPDHLFSQRNLATLLGDQIHKMVMIIDELSDDVFLQNSSDDLIEAISQDAYVQPLELLKDHGISHPPIKITNKHVWGSPVPISGFQYAIEVPYTGASGLLIHQPDTYDLDKPTAQLNSGNMQGSLIFTPDRDGRNHAGCTVRIVRGRGAKSPQVHRLSGPPARSVQCISEG
jgi:hypothetical protein